ncbi:hypothetical protein ACFYXW_30075 [Streptomyces sp. NPDC001981]|uniref:hypothetical protein n=1 Tax=Streptomyces sp. NPDC001981 TaxID=3364628 RepID=UPI0036A562C8
MSTLSLSGPARVVVLQHRRTLWTVGALALAGIATVVGTWLWMGSVSHSFAGTGCSVEHTVMGCGVPVRHFLASEHIFSRLLTYAGLVMMLLPALIGMFVAGPMIGRELESGTYKLSWTQAVSPARWLAAKLAVPAVLSLAGVSVLSAVYAWARAQGNNTHYTSQWYDREVYGSMGTVPAGYALCMLAFGALAGLVLRRTVSAMFVTVIGYSALVMALNTVRNDLWPTRTDTSAVGSAYGFPFGGADTGQGWLTSGGKRLPADVCQKNTPVEFKNCLTEEHITLRYLDYHPASHFWPLQLVETGILLVLAAAAVALAFRVLRRRHG